LVNIGPISKKLLDSFYPNKKGLRPKKPSHATVPLRYDSYWAHDPEIFELFLKVIRTFTEAKRPQLNVLQNFQNFVSNRKADFFMMQLQTSPK
jgi:hypothetical protein